jgi:recombinational DNA repair protein (RecF pathway)
MSYLKFKEGVKVEIAECYLTDEVTEPFRDEISSNATVCSEPRDEEELVYVQYESGLIDIVPQDILTIV